MKRAAKHIKHIVACFLLLGFSAWSFPAFTQTNSEREMQKVLTSIEEYLFENEDCARTNTCSLQRVKFKAEQFYVIENGAKVYSTRLIAWYEADTIAHLRDYVFVQFIEGCAFISYFNAKEKKLSILMRTYPHFGKTVPLHHPSPVIDSPDTDPAYFSSPNFDRHFAYRWHSRRGVAPRDHTNVFGLSVPPYPELYITDTPAMQARAFDIETPLERAYNTSLRFKTCLYREKDVPKSVPDGTYVNFGEPIVCFSWKSSYVFDHVRNIYTEPQEVAEVCRLPSGKEEKDTRVISVPEDKPQPQKSSKSPFGSRGSGKSK